MEPITVEILKDTEGSLDGVHITQFKCGSVHKGSSQNAVSLLKSFVDRNLAKIHDPNHEDKDEDGKDEDEQQLATKQSTSKRNPPLRNEAEKTTAIFVVHGRNEQLRKSLFHFLRAIGLRPLEWSQAVRSTGKATPYIGDVLDSAFQEAQAIIVLLTGDDEARLREPFIREGDEHYEKNLTPQARPNVLFEAGMAYGRCPDRTVLVEVGSLRPFSDIAGRHVIRLDDSTRRRQELAQRLETAGCIVDLSGTEWHDIGDFRHKEPGLVDPGSEGNSVHAPRLARKETATVPKNLDENVSAPRLLDFVAEKSDHADIEIIDFIGRVTERGSVYSTLGWTVLLRNRGNKPERCSVKFNYRDRTPVGIKMEIFKTPLIPAESTREISGTHTIKNAVADQIEEVLFIVE